MHSSNKEAKMINTMLALDIDNNIGFTVKLSEAWKGSSHLQMKQIKTSVCTLCKHIIINATKNFCL